MESESHAEPGLGYLALTLTEPYSKRTAPTHTHLRKMVLILTTGGGELKLIAWV